uniref:Cytochrome c oxidase assembly protein COX16 homolog, mitochondrial n=1 Tax=Fopius arisanus TaxID=64838 RepID=A0A0C9R4P9_9HYME
MKLELANIKGTLLRLSKKRSVKQGLPFVLFIIGASFGLGQFTNLRYEYRKTKQTQEKMQDVGLPMRKAEEITLEAQYDIVKEVIPTTYDLLPIFNPMNRSFSYFSFNY